MSEQFSITPTVFWALTWDEYRAYLDHIEATDRAMENATDGS